MPFIPYLYLLLLGRYYGFKNFTNWLITANWNDLEMIWYFTGTILDNTYHLKKEFFELAQPFSHNLMHTDKQTNTHTS